MKNQKKIVLFAGIILLVNLFCSHSFAKSKETSSLKGLGIVNTSGGHYSKDHWNEKIKKGEVTVSHAIKPGSYADVGTNTGTFIGKDAEGNLYYAEGNYGKEERDRPERDRIPTPPKPKKPDDSLVLERVNRSKVKWTRTTYTYDEASNSWKANVTYGSAELTMKANIYDHQGKQKNSVTTKSGYGVQVDVKTKMIVQGDQTGITITENKNANAVTMYTVNKPKPQPKKLPLQKIDENTFVTGTNPLSKTKAKVIYTDTAMKNGKYQIEAEVFGVSVNGLDLSNSEKLSFIIQGSMYDDSHVRPTDEKKSKNNTGFKKFD